MDRNTLGLVFHPTRDVSAVAGTIVAWAGRHGLDVYVRHEDRHRAPPGVIPVSAAELASGADALVSIGGDGTMLGALRLTVDDPKPVLGVRLGRLGFLVEVEPTELPAALDRISSRDFTLEPHSCLRGRVGDADVVAFNDIALARQPGAGSVNAVLAIDGQRYGHYRCDTLIVSTPTGSTAYSYAAGGPLVSPAAQAMVVTPSAPMAGISRSVVLAPDELIRLDLRADTGPVAVEVDGQPIRELTGGDVAELCLRRRAGLVVRLDPRRYRQRSQLKLSLLDLPLLPEQLRELLPDSLRVEFERRQRIAR